MNTEKNKGISYQSELMQRVLEVRYTDIEEEKTLCKQLLEVSDAEQYAYGMAFANVYLLDSHLALGEYSSCDFYLLRADNLCKENSFDDLTVMLYNCAGLYYQKLNDDQRALGYFMAGTKLAKRLGDTSLESKFYNNIGYSFARNEDMETARKYFELAYKTIEPFLHGDNIRSAIFYLSNLAETSRYQEGYYSSKEIVKKCEELSGDDAYSRIRLGSSWCSLYAVSKKKDKCAAIVDKLMEDLIKATEKFFVCDMAMGLCNNMLDVGDRARAEKLLELIRGLDSNTALLLEQGIVDLDIKYYQAFGPEEELDKAYKHYYEIVCRNSKIESETRVQSMLSKLQIHKATLEREFARQTVRELENASQLDELTGLYNRRYFNKLVSKVTNGSKVETLGFIMVDVDYFKQYNDYYGHFKGDAALRAVGGCLSQCAVEGIYVSRYGGDEFVCLCVNLTNEQTYEYAKKVVDNLIAQNIPHEDSKCAKTLTISVGYCNESYNTSTDHQDLLNLADKALYRAKEGGRARIVKFNKSEL